MYEPRFIHAPESLNSKKHTGFTVAYHRDANAVYFAVSLVCNNDKYDKSIGRELTTTLLDTHVESLSSEATYYSAETRVGVITLTDIMQSDTITYAIADQTIKNLNMFDLKHAFISGIISRLIWYVYDDK